MHPEQRRRGQARRLQRHIIDAAIARFPALSHVRYTTGSWNKSSLRLAAACGLGEVWRWGVQLCADTKDAPEDKREDDEVVFAPRPFVEYRHRILGECRKLPLKKLLSADEYSKVETALTAAGDTVDSVPTATATATKATRLRSPDAATAADIVDLMSLEGGEGPVSPTWVVDWKGVNSTRENLEKVLERPAWSSRCFRCGNKGGGYVGCAPVFQCV